MKQEMNNHQREEIKLLGEKLNNEARRIKSLERESDRLRSEISLLESKVGFNSLLQIHHLFYSPNLSFTVEMKLSHIIFRPPNGELTTRKPW